MCSSDLIQDITPPVTIKSTSTLLEVDLRSSGTINSVVDISYKTSSIIDTPLANVKTVLVTSVQDEITSTLQSVRTESATLTRSQFQVTIIPPPSGAIDGYQEILYWTDPIITRTGQIDLDNRVTLPTNLDLYYNFDIPGSNANLNLGTDQLTVTTVYEEPVRHVVARGNTIIYITNLAPTDTYYVGSYTKTNAGQRIANFNGFFDDGVCDVSGISLEEFSRYYPNMTIQDFAERYDSSYTLTGSYFNLLPPSIQNPVTTSTSSGTIPSTIVVAKTTYFPSSGYIYHSNGTNNFGIIQYTGKTTTSFTGCTRYNGSTTISASATIIPFEIT